MWQLARYSRKPMLKRFWDHMCKTLNRRYTLFDAQDVVSGPKKRKKTYAVLQSYKLRMMEAEYCAQRAEDRIIELKKQLTTEQDELRKFKESCACLYKVEQK